MVKCWRFKPKQRPTFKDIINLLLEHLDDNFRVVSYYFSEENRKYEESKRLTAATNQEDIGDVDYDDNINNRDSDVDDDTQCPINDYVDARLQEQLPMLGAGASNGHSVELQDLFSDNGMNPYSGSQNRPHEGSAEVCDCTEFRGEDEGAAAPSVLHNRRSLCSSPHSAIGGSSDGSKDSSKSSSSSYAHMNGISVANGHVPVHLRTTEC